MLTPTAVEAATPVPARRPSPQMQAARSNLGAVAQDSPQQQPCRRHPTRALLPRKVGRVPRLRRRLSMAWPQAPSSLCSAARGRVWCTRALKASRNTAMYLAQSTTRRPPTNSDALYNTRSQSAYFGGGVIDLRARLALEPRPPTASLAVLRDRDSSRWLWSLE